MDKTKEIHGLMKIPVEALYEESKKEVSILNFEIGKLKSEIDHLTEQLKRFNTFKQQNKTLNKQVLAECKKEELYQQIKAHNRHLMVEVKRLRNDKDQLIAQVLKKHWPVENS